jgi:phage regulator Rha-like protein
MIDSDLTAIYNIETRVLKQAVRRNIDRFPRDFMFELTKDEYDSLRSQSVTLKRGQHAKYLPFVFTEHGSLMLASILKSEVAVKASLNIVRAFVKLREMLASNKELAQKIEILKQKYDKQFKVVFAAIKQLMQEPETGERKELGYKYKNKK